LVGLFLRWVATLLSAGRVAPSNETTAHLQAAGAFESLEEFSRFEERFSHVARSRTGAADL
jgi:hypothetical protein